MMIDLIEVYYLTNNASCNWGFEPLSKTILSHVFITLSLHLFCFLN